MLGGVVDDAHQPRAGGDRRIPVGVDDSGEFFGGDPCDVLCGSSCEPRGSSRPAGRPGPSLCRLRLRCGRSRANPWAGQAEAIYPTPVNHTWSMPAICAELRILNAGTVPEQPRDAVRGAGWPVCRKFVGEVFGDVLDVLDEAGERVPQSSRAASASLPSAVWVSCTKFCRNPYTGPQSQGQTGQPATRNSSHSFDYLLQDATATPRRRGLPPTRPLRVVRCVRCPRPAAADRPSAGYRRIRRPLSTDASPSRRECEGDETGFASRVWEAGTNQYQTQAAFLRRLGPTVDQLENRPQSGCSPGPGYLCASAATQAGGTPVALSSASEPEPLVRLGECARCRRRCGQAWCNGCWPPDILRLTQRSRCERRSRAGCRSELSQRRRGVQPLRPEHRGCGKPAQCRAGGVGSAGAQRGGQFDIPVHIHVAVERSVTPGKLTPSEKATAHRCAAKKGCMRARLRAWPGECGCHARHFRPKLCTTPALGMAKSARPRGPGTLRKQDLEVHATHTTGRVASRCCGLLRLVGDDGLGRQEQSRDGRRILQRRAVTLTGSATPALSRSSYSLVAALRPVPVAELRTFSATTPGLPGRR